MRISDWSSDVCSSDLQAGTALHSPEVPESHGGRYEISSSGSTGRPVKAQGTQLAQFIWDALTLREHSWHRRDFGGTLAAIRALPNGVAAYPQGPRGKLWGRAMKGLLETGRSAGMSLRWGERRVGKESGRTGRARWWRDN